MVVMAAGINMPEVDFGLRDVNKFWPNGFPFGGVGCTSKDHNTFWILTKKMT